MNQNSKRIEIKLSQVIEMLEEGKTRQEIGVFYNLSKSDLSLLFKHEKLKGRRAKKTPTIIITDDTVDTVTTTTSEEILEERVFEDVEQEVSY